MFVYSGLPWTIIRNEYVVGWTVTKQKHCPLIIIRQAHSGRELCRHIVKPLTLTTSQLSHQTDSIENDGERDGNQSTQDDMILSNSIVNLNIQ